MVDDEPLAEGWEAVTDDEGRTYWWNTETNETTWTKPVAVVAKKGLAAGGGPTSPRGPPQPGSTGSPRSIAPLDGCRCSVAAGYLSKVAGDKPEEKSSQLDDLARLRQQGGTARPDSSSWQRRSFPPTARGALVLAHGATPLWGQGRATATWDARTAGLGPPGGAGLTLRPAIQAIEQARRAWFARPLRDPT